MLGQPTVCLFFIKEMVPEICKCGTNTVYLTFCGVPITVSVSISSIVLGHFVQDTVVPQLLACLCKVDVKLSQQAACLFPVW